MAFVFGFVSSVKYLSTFLTSKESSHMIEYLPIGFTFFLLYYERYYQYMCNEIEYEMIIEMLQKAKQKEQKKIEKPIEILVN